MTGELRYSRLVSLILYGVLPAGLFLCQGCSTATQPKPQRSDSAADTAKASAESEDKTILAVTKAIRRNHLVSQRDECIAYEFDADASKETFIVEVRENHRDSKCQGDPQTSPRLFTVRVNKKTGRMSTDANSPSGDFHTLPFE